MIARTRLIGEVSYRRPVEGIVNYALYLLDLDGTVKSWNSGAQRVNGYSAEDIVGSNFSVFYTDDDVRAGQPAYSLAIARAAGRFEAEGWRVRKDGTRLWASVLIDAVHNHAGDVTGFVKITLDLTQTHAEQTALAEQQELCRLIVETAPNGMLIADGAGIITLANSRVESIFGYPPGGLLGQPVDNLIPQMTRAGHATAGESFTQFAGRRHNGTTVPIEVTLNPITTTKGRAVVASVIGIAERRIAGELPPATTSQLHEKYRLMAMAEQMSHIGHWRLDVRSNEVLWSDGMYRTFDLPTAFQPTLKNSMAAYHPDDRDEARAVIQLAVTEGIPYRRESRAVRPDGTVRHIVASGQPEYASDGTIVAVFGVFQDVTEMKEAERERARLLERVTLATHALQVGIWDWDITTDALVWDPIMFALYGYDDAQLVPTFDAWSAALHEDDRAQAKRELAQAAASGEAFESGFRVVWPNGEVHYIRAMATVVCDGAGSPTRMIGTNWDVTEARMLAEDLRATGARDRATAAMLTSANHLMKMAEQMAHYGHWRIDLLSDDVYWSDEVYRIHGLPATYNPTIESSIAAYDRHGSDIRTIVRQASIDGKPFVYEARILRPDKSFRDVRCLGRGDFSADGSLVALVGIVQDITERKDAERVRDRLTERVSLATKTGKVGIWEWAIGNGTMTWLTHMFALYGLDASTAVPSYELWKSALHDRDRELTVRAFEDALAGGEPFDTEHRIVWPNGEIHNLRSQAKVLRDAADEPVRMVGITWDITEVRSLADQMHEEQERLQVSERERLYEHERRWSRTFQRAVLPLSLPRVTGCTFDAVYEPGLGDAQVGGDWYDVVHLSDGRILVSIGDVAGSGLPAAVVVGVARQIIRGISQLHASPILILDAADRALCLEYPGVYVSAWVGLIDLVTCTITYASAGHPPPLLVSKDGAVRELDEATSMLIGLRQGHRGQASTVKITQGDALVLYTDGITEAGRDVIAGTRSLSEAAATFATAENHHPAEFIKRQVIPSGSADDVALLVVRTDCREAERYINRWQFDVGDGDAAGMVRGKFVESLECHGFTTDARANAELVFGELIGNVVRHANHAGAVEVAVNHGGPDTVLHVMDHGTGFNHISRLPRDLYAEDGRGLFLIAALTADFTVSERPDGGSHARAVLVRNAA